VFDHDLAWLNSSKCLFDYLCFMFGESLLLKSVSLRGLGIRTLLFIFVVDVEFLYFIIFGWNVHSSSSCSIFYSLYRSYYNSVFCFCRTNKSACERFSFLVGILVLSMTLFMWFLANLSVCSLFYIDSIV
jgi:hypothetical protein